MADNFIVSIPKDKVDEVKSRLESLDFFKVGLGFYNVIYNIRNLEDYDRILSDLSTLKRQGLISNYIANGAFPEFNLETWESY